ncbi:MAG: 30S ribosomal protein S16 [Candidatus Shapirobacteria bacterium]
MLKVKLQPRGKIHQRSYRIVIAPLRSKHNGKVVAQIGFYTPQTKTLEIDKVALEKWLKNGAQLTTGVDKLLNPDKYPRKKKKQTATATEKKPKIDTETAKEEVKEEVKEETKNE